MEQLALGAGHGLEIVQVEAAVQAAPGIQDQQGADAVVAVAVNGPVGNHHVRFFLLQQFPHLAVALAVQFRIAIHLVHEQEPGTGDGAGSLHFLYADGGRFVVRFAGDAGFAPGQVDAYHFVARRGKQAHGAAGAGFRVVRMSPDNQDFLFAFHRLISGWLRAFSSQWKAQDRHGGGSCGGFNHFPPVHINRSIRNRNPRRRHRCGRCGLRVFRV